jgi:uncharacterized protein YcbK (DUF882 family)
MTNVTDHFTVEEWKCHDGTDYPAEWVGDRLTPLCSVLEVLRAELGGHAITILSGYRSPAHNQAVGGASASQHMEGRAADITVEGFAPSDVHRALLQLFQAGKIEIGGLGRYPGWVHVDVRPRPASGHLAQWEGTKVGDEVA